MENNYQETEDLMKDVADIISTIFDGWGFALLIFPLNNYGIGNYISNAERKDMIQMLRETANRIEKNMDIPPIQGSA